MLTWWVLLVVEELEVERVVELLLQPGGRVGEDVSELGQGVQQVRVGRCVVFPGEGVEFGADGGAFFFQFGEPGDDPVPQRGDGGGVGVVRVGEVLDFAGVGGRPAAAGPPAPDSAAITPRTTAARMRQVAAIRVPAVRRMFRAGWRR